MSTLWLQEDQVSLDVTVDHRIHSRLIGSRGRAIRKIMDDYKVDIKFPSRDGSDPDVVTITGAEDNVYECQDHILNLAEEYVSIHSIAPEVTDGQVVRAGVSVT